MTKRPTLRRMKPAAWVLLFLGVVLAGLGIYLGNAGVTRLSTNCGSGFGGVSQDATVADYAAAIEADASGESIASGDLTRVSAECKSAVSDRKTLALIVLVPGIAVALVGAGLGMAVWQQRVNAEQRPTA